MGWFPGIHFEVFLRNLFGWLEAGKWKNFSLRGEEIG